MKVKQNVMKGIEGLAEYLAKNSVKTSMPIFSHNIIKKQGKIFFILIFLILEIIPYFFLLLIAEYAPQFPQASRLF